MFAGALGVEGRHQECFLFGANEQQAGTLVCMGVESEQPLHVRARGKRDEAGTRFGHAAAQGRQTPIEIHAVLPSLLMLRAVHVCRFRP